MDGVRNRKVSPEKAKKAVSIISDTDPIISRNSRESHIVVPKNLLLADVVDTQQPSTSYLKLNRKRNRQLGFIFALFMALLVDYFVVSQLNRVNIRINPHREQLVIDTPITAYRNAGSNQLEFSIIALTETIATELTPDTSELIETFAQGEVKVFNDYSTSPQRLAPRTRVEAINGLVYTTGDSEVIIPGKTEYKPGEVLVTITSTLAGDEYNIDATDFSFPGFHEQGLDEKYAQIYGISLKSFTGGGRKMTPTVSFDIKNVEVDKLESDLTTRLQELLLAEKTPEMFLIQKTPMIQYQEAVYLPDETGKVSLSLSGTIYALLLDSNELGYYLADTYLPLDKGLQATLVSGSTVNPILVDTSFDYDFQNVASVSFTLQDASYFVWEVNADMVKDLFVGVPVGAIENLVERTQWIGSLNYRLHPRWNNYFPLNSEKIQIKIIN